MANYNDSKSDQMFSREPLKKRAAPIWRDLRILVAVQLYMLGRISSDRASKLADVPHVEFLLSLGFYKVFPLQAELVELERAAFQAKGKPKETVTTPAGETKVNQSALPNSLSKDSSPADSGKKPGSNPPPQETQEKI
jgi:hypothetical protein